MSKNPFDPLFEDLRKAFPSSSGGFVVVPQGDLPLNLFGPRYIAMVDDVFDVAIALLNDSRPQDVLPANGPAIFSTGCAGRITQFQKLKIDISSLSLRALWFELQKTPSPSWVSARQDRSGPVLDRTWNIWAVPN